VGKEIAGKGIIGNENDIFYLRKEELDNIIEHIGKPEMGSFHDVIKKRKIEMEETKDIVLPPVIYGEEAPMPAKDNSKNHSGTGTSSGTYTGITRVVRSSREFSAVVKGDVLLIPFSDVSWTPILARAGAIVSETGGMLSHCSIIAREMGIPALVSVPNACAIGNGLSVTVNGSNGIMTVHDYE
jgi:pyruvate,water dikinase